MKTTLSTTRHDPHEAREIQHYWYDLKRAIRTGDALGITRAQRQLDYLLDRLCLAGAPR